jgi:poly-beta-1,6-N-acetyl-D-glucosamine synthase
MDILGVVLIFGLAAYCAAVAVVAAALGKVRGGTSSSTPSVSVVVAAHNEEARLGRCLESLGDQDYPLDRYEVIVANDRSTDGTGDIIRRYEALQGRLRSITLDNPPSGISPKKHALSAAISAARGEIVLQTDADCEVPNHWISGMAERFEPGVAFVAGIAPYRAGKSALDSFVGHEYLWNASLSAASIALGRGTHASGRNLGFRRDVFERVGGYGGTARILSGDDTLLLHRIANSGLGAIVTMPERSTHVLTDAPQGFRAFLRQRIRHMSTGRYFPAAQLIIGAIVYGFHLSLLAVFALSPFLGEARVLFLGGFIGKAAADAVIGLRAERTLGLEVQWRRFVFNELLMIPYMAFMPLAGFLIPARWKEKTIENTSVM